MTLTEFILTQLKDPENRKIVNKGQPYFNIDYDEKGDNVVIFVNGRGGNLNYEDEAGKLFVLRWCINLLPCFYLHLYDLAVEYANIDLAVSTVAKILAKSGYPQTLRQALLSAPVLTVEELEKFVTDNNLIPNI